MSLERQFSADGELMGIAVLNNGHLLFETTNPSDFDAGPLDLKPGYYEYDDAKEALLDIGGYDAHFFPERAPGGRRPAVLSPEGERLAISADGINVWIYDLASRALERKTEFATNPYPGGVGEIRWSPGGNHIAFEQFESYDREVGRFENRIAILDLASDHIEIISDSALTRLIDLPPDFNDNQSFFKPVGWDNASTAVFVYFEATTNSEDFGHLDDSTYPNRRRLHSFWLLDLNRMQVEALPWFDQTHAIFPAHFNELLQ